MQTIKYNNVELEIIRTLPTTVREQVMSEDGATYLYTHWVIDVIAHITKIDTPGDPVPILPGETDNTIRNQLMQPRRQLQVIAGGAEILFSPRRIPNRGNEVYPCDAKNGPYCNVFGIQQIIGISLFVIHCRFETWDVEYDPSEPHSTKAPNVVLSNRWVSAEDIDELCYPTRYISGEAILRTDLMQQRNIERRNANQSNFNAADITTLRRYFFFPVPNNYQRQNVRVELSTDGSRLKWSFEDVGRCYNLGGDSPIRKIEVYRNACTEFHGLGAIAADAGWNALGGLENFGTWGGAQNPGIIRSFRAKLPQYYISARVDLWGDRDVEQGHLFVLALGCCMNQIGFNTAAFTVGAAKMVSSQYLHEKFARVELTVSWGEDGNAIFLVNPAAPVIAPFVAANVAAGLRSLVNAMCPLSDKTVHANVVVSGRDKILDQTGIMTNNPTIGSLNLNNGNAGLVVGSLGGTICSLVSQILEEPNEAPIAPQIPMPLKIP
jgi:hypothetical protein